MALSVPIAFLVGLIVFLVVGDEIPQRKAVMGGDKVDRCDRASGRVLVQIRRPSESGCELAQGRRSLRQKSRTVSRYLPFHSVHCGGKFPT